MNEVAIAKFKERRSNKPRVFCRVYLPCGMVLEDVDVYQGDDECRVLTPVKPTLAPDSAVMCDRRDQIKCLLMRNSIANGERDHLPHLPLQAFLPKYLTALDR